MTTDEHRLSRKTLNVIAASVIVSAVLLGLLYTVGTHRCLEKTLGFGQETMVFLENACEKYDRYEQGRKTEATHDLLAAVESFVTFLSSDRVEVNDDLIEQFVHAENLSGLMVMDSDATYCTNSCMALRRRAASLFNRFSSSRLACSRCRMGSSCSGRVTFSGSK